MKLTDVEKECLSDGRTKEEISEGVQSFLDWYQHEYIHVRSAVAAVRFKADFKALGKMLGYKGPPKFRPLYNFAYVRLNKLWTQCDMTFPAACWTYQEEVYEAWRALKKMMVVKQFVA